MLNLPVILAIDRAGLVGEDGETHHGIYDVGFLRHAPGMKILCPASMQESEDMFRWAACNRTGPVAIRYPRGGNGQYTDSGWTENNKKVCVHRKGNDLTIITYGTIINNAIAAAELLSEQGIEVTVLRLTQINPLNMDDVISEMPDSKLVFVLEEVAGNCGIKEQLAFQLSRINPNYCVDGIDLGNQYIQHGSIEKLYEHYGLSPMKVVQRIREVHYSEN